jgi:hypothetical protein
MNKVRGRIIMRHIRAATEEEVKAIKDKSDITPESFVLALDSKTGTDIAVVRKVWELDPVFFSDKSNGAQRARFIYGLEERMLGYGIQAYYFNVWADAENASWRKTVTEWGAEQVSQDLELRFKKVLI